MMQATSRDWCGTCCTQHPRTVACPGGLPVTGSERRGWTVKAMTPGGVETFGVLIAPSHNLWRARIVTLPDIDWFVPGSRRSMKFVGSSSKAVEREAARAILEVCRRRGFKLLDADAPAAKARDVTPVPVGQAAGKKPARRKLRFLPVRFGVASPSEAGGTGNLSETGLFIVTEAPVRSGKRIAIKMSVVGSAVSMKGEVRWHRGKHPNSGTPGMGVQLLAPPRTYVDFVRGLE